MKLFSKILIPSLSGLALLAGLSLIVSMSNLNRRGQDEIKDLRSIMMAEKTEKLKNLVEVAYHAVAGIHARSDLSTSEQQVAAKEIIKAIRFDKSNYIWINDMQPIMVMHPIKSDLDGKDLSTYKDPNGKKLFVEFVKVCARQKEGTVDYLWPKPGFEKPVPKLSYVKIFEPWGWVIGTGIYMEDVDAMVAEKEIKIENELSSQRNVMLLIALVVLGLCSVMLVWSIRKVTVPIGNTILMLKDIAQGEGDLTRRLEVRTADEVGELSKWFNLFVDKLQGIIKDIAGSVGTFSSSSAELSAISGKMSQGVLNVSGKSNTVSAAAEEMTTNMNTVAASMEQSATNTNMVASAVEEMSTTIGEIAKNAEKARAISDEATQKASGASANMDQLGNAANAIGKVVETITDISEQVNLLALNATIEAARAGDAGKGFAVVANEIKELAKQTAEATQDIKDKIEAIQGTTSTTVDQIVEITQVITNVNSVVTNIAAAVEQQSAATKEIAGNVTQASQGIQEVNENVNQSSSVSSEISKDIADVSVAMNEMSASSAQVNMSAQNLSSLSDQLKQMLDQFKY